MIQVMRKGTVVPSRLSLARREAGLTQEKSAEQAGLTRVSIARYETGHRAPSELALNMLATIYEKPVEWFFVKEEQPSAPPVHGKAEAQASPATAESLGAVVSLDDRLSDFGSRFDRLESALRGVVIAGSRAEYDAGDDESTVRPVEVVEVAAAAGGGAEVYDETVVGRLWFRRDWLQRHAMDPAQCHVITVHGQSMEPTLPDGCSILVDRSQRRRRRRERRIFVMRTEDGLVVKRAGKDTEGNWQIESDNEGWEPVPWSRDTEIIGEVRWSAVTF